MIHVEHNVRYLFSLFIQTIWSSQLGPTPNIFFLCIGFLNPLHLYLLMLLPYNIFRFSYASIILSVGVQYIWYAYGLNGLSTVVVKHIVWFWFRPNMPQAHWTFRNIKYFPVMILSAAYVIGPIFISHTWKKDWPNNACY